MKSFVLLLFLYSSFTSCAAQRRVINGTTAKDGQFPYFAQVMDGPITICGASIIHKRWLLSAAHCFEKPIKNLSIVVGTVENYGLHGQEYSVEKLIKHEGYLSLVFAWDTTEDVPVNDIALIRVNKSIEFSKKVTPIELPKHTSIKYDGDSVTIIGMGHTGDPSKTRAYVLQYTSVEVVSLDQCKQKWHFVDDRNLCTSKNQTLTCHGDSGGPVVNEGLLIGIVSFGPKGCKPYKPDVHARVSSFLDWIKKKMSLYSDQLP